MKAGSVALLASIALSGCSSTYEGEVGFVEGFYGGVAADEPRAALIGRDVLTSGGTAADAVTAMYFTLSATMPHAAGLGGGGLCLVHDAETKKTVSLDFLPRPATGKGGDRPTAIPGNPRGFFALHAKYGRLRWETLVSSAESVARFGAPISRAFAAALKPIGNALLADASARAIFARADGQPVGEGDFLRQLDAASILGQLRAKGPGDFYTGHLARQVVDAYARAGGTLTLQDLRGYSPRWADTLQAKRGNETVHFPSTTAGGQLSHALWQALEKGDSFADAAPAAKSQVMAMSAAKAFHDTGLAGTPQNPSATGFVAADQDGNAVACVVTLNAPFGTGRVAQGTGIIPAAMPDNKGRGAAMLTAMLMMNHHVNEFHFAATASGGPLAPTALMNVAARALLDENALVDAQRSVRIHHGGAPNVSYYEDGLDSAALGTLQAGGQTAATQSMGTVNAIGCPNGIPPNPENCAAVTDPRRAGLAAMSEAN